MTVGLVTDVLGPSFGIVLLIILSVVQISCGLIASQSAQVVRYVMLGLVTPHLYAFWATFAQNLVQWDGFGLAFAPAGFISGVVTILLALLIKTPIKYTDYALIGATCLFLLYPVKLFVEQRKYRSGYLRL